MKKLNTKLENKSVGAIINRQKGITLIALVITIIVLIILAGVAINLTLGENGILSKAETAKLKYEIGKAEEELDIKIAELQVKKQGSATLQDVVDMLKAEEDMDYIVSLEEIATITGVETIGDVDEIYVVYKIYQFRVDNKLQTEFISIVESYTADVTISSTLKSHDGKSEDEKYLATFEIKVESEGQVQSIEIETVDGKVTETPTSLPYTKEIQVEIGQKYIVKVTTPDGKYKRYVIEEKAEETIKTAAELAAFRDKVNSGLTYEGKTITLANDIDLSSVCGENVNGQEVSWEPIGNSITFKGIFNGNYNTISKLYINYNDSASSVAIGLFSNNYGKIQNLKIKEVDINVINTNTSNGSVNIGSIVGGNIGQVVSCGVEDGTIIVSSYNLSAGGIVGYAGNASVTSNCYNKAIINATANALNRTGGVVGQAVGKLTVENCYNIGDVTSSATTRTQTGGVVGMMYGKVTNETPKIVNSYNVGIITAGGGSQQNVAGGIVGTNGEASVKKGTITNSYCSTTNSYSYSYGSGNSNHYTDYRLEPSVLQGYATTLGDAYIADGKIKNENGEWVDNVDSQGNIIYINGGYPILKWQIGE